jgi:hypothetical protein
LTGGTRKIFYVAANWRSPPSEKNEPAAWIVFGAGMAQGGVERPLSLDWDGVKFALIQPRWAVSHQAETTKYRNTTPPVMRVL